MAYKNRGGGMREYKTKRGKYHEWLTDEGLIKIEGWAMDGLSDEQIAHNIGIVPSTLYEWKKKYSEISEALKKGKEIIDRQVENALLKRALGFEYEETKKIQEKDANGKDRIRIEKFTKTMAPDTGAIAFWLKNRKPAEWRDKQNLEVEGNLDISNMDKLITDYLSDDDG